MNPEAVVQAIAVAWEQITQALGVGLPAFEAELTPLLRNLEAAPRGASLDAVFALFARQSSHVQVIFRESLARAGAIVTKGAEAAPLRRHERYTTVPVFYGTSRAPAEGTERSSWFGAGRATNSFGVATVSIPDDHRMGSLEKPRWFRLQFRPDPDKHVVLLNVEGLERTIFIDRAREAVAGARKQEVLVFVHGYNVTFEDAARRAAQVAYDMHYEGVPALYSWPSEGTLAGYVVDANNATWAEPHFREFLRLVREELAAQTVHILAHSMGARLLANTVATLADAPGAPGRLRQVVFAAPDVDADTFRNLAAAFGGKAERVTLYASSADRALEVSQRFQKYPRAGQSGLDMVLVSSIDTIDASSVRTELLGHSYFGDADTVLSDLFYLIRNGSAPGERARLREQRRYGFRFWEFVR